MHIIILNFVVPHIDEKKVAREIVFFLVFHINIIPKEKFNFHRKMCLHSEKEKLF